jgi:uncharacterized protein YndB with AHSA1/START domain
LTAVKAKPAPAVSLTLKRHYQASPERVFAAWTTPALLARWMAPSDDFAPTAVEIDPRPGGRYRFVMTAPDGTRPTVGGTFEEVAPPERLVFTWAWQGTPERVSLVTVSLEPKDGGTALTLHHERLVDEVERGKHEHGWTGCLRRLALVLEP